MDSSANNQQQHLHLKIKKIYLPTDPVIFALNIFSPEIKKYMNSTEIKYSMDMPHAAVF